MRRIALLAAAVSTLAIGACSSLPAQRFEPFKSLQVDPDRRVAACARFLGAVDDAVDAAGVRDGAAWRIPGYPFLRADRLAAAGQRYMHEDEWLGRLRDLDRKGRHFELANLPEHAVPGLNARAALVAPDKPLEEAVDGCAATLLEHSRQAQALPASVTVPDEYSTGKRLVGLYWISRIPVARGIQRYQKQTEQTFSLPIEALPIKGRLVRHVPASGAAALAYAGVESGMAELVARNAPVLEIDTHTDHDRFGMPEIDDDGSPQVDVAHPTMFVRLANTVLDGRALTQIVYSVWFPSRPKTSAGDLYGGALDGITWRVTLGPDGRPWVYDSIHNCGCYHQFFPTPRAASRSSPGPMDEGMFSPQSLPAVGPESRIVLRIASGTHYIERVSVVPDPVDGATFALADDDSLRSILQRDGSRRSLFDEHGIVPGTRRLERLALWPMGVREPGSMRQWGRHATAFVGRRHMDDPDLISRYFEFRP